MKMTVKYGGVVRAGRFSDYKAMDRLDEKTFAKP
jgi:hypothetical protein